MPLAAERGQLQRVAAAVVRVDEALSTGADHRPAAIALRDGLTAHLRHEEEAALPLVDATLTPEEWKAFGAAHRERILDDVHRYLPWLLDELPAERVRRIIAGLKLEVLVSYETE